MAPTAAPAQTGTGRGAATGRANAELCVVGSTDKLDSGPQSFHVGKKELDQT